MSKKFALLVGCNYSNNPNVPEGNRLHGCINDVNAMQTLIRQRFSFEDITILTDAPGTKNPPTSSDIRRELRAKVSQATKRGGTLLFYFSGGGARVTSGDKKKKTISVIVPSDLKPITGKQILDIIKDFPATVICDSSYSGGLFQKINAQIEANVAENKPNFGSKTIDIPGNLLESIDFSECPSNKCNTFSSSMSNEKSVEVYLNGDTLKAFSAYSSAIQALFNSPRAKITLPAKKNSDVKAFTTELLKSLEFGQHPHYDSIANNAAAPFLGGYVK